MCREYSVLARLDNLKIKISRRINGEGASELRNFLDDVQQHDVHNVNKSQGVQQLVGTVCRNLTGSIKTKATEKQ